MPEVFSQNKVVQQKMHGNSRMISSTATCVLPLWGLVLGTRAAVLLSYMGVAEVPASGTVVNEAEAFSQSTSMIKTSLRDVEFG